MPLHIFLSTWIGTSFGILDFAKVAKDVVLVIGFLMALLASVRQSWFRDLLRDRLIWLIASYILLTLVLALIRPTDQDAEVLGIVYNTRFLVFFVYGWLLTRLFVSKQLVRRATGLVLGVGGLVALFGIAQYMFLPDDALTRIGYSRDNGVLPAFFIDDKPDLERIMSTVRDPNSFGSYIIIIGSFALVAWVRAHSRKVRQYGLWLLILSALGLILTFSRSAWLGFVLAVVVVAAIGLNERRAWLRAHRGIVFGGIAASVVMLGLGLFMVRDSYLVQNIVFHADESTVLEDPNEKRARFIKESVDDIAEHPLGTGPGTAGLVSIHNDTQGTVLNENYYLQIAQEVGLLGLALFVAILVAVSRRLYRLAGSDQFALGLLASFAGLALTNLLVHIWSNEAVAYTWWGLAGLVINAALVIEKVSYNKQTTK